MMLQHLNSNEEIEQKIGCLAAQIIDFLQSKNINKVCLLPVLNGGIPFSVEVSKHLSKTFPNLEMASVWISRYSMVKTNESTMNIQYHVDLDKFDHFLILDDILDTGETLNILINDLQVKGKEVYTAVLYDKIKSRTQNGLEKADFTCFEINTHLWLLGWGMDIHGIGRGLRNTYLIDPSCTSESLENELIS
jgi:hypoxanthine phosphoribosyltransferase